MSDVTIQDVEKLYSEMAPVKRADFKKAFDGVVRMVQVAQSELAVLHSQMHAEMSGKIDAFNQIIEKRLSELKDGKDGVNADHERIVNDVLKNIRQPKDGDTPVIDHLKIAQEAAKLIPTPKNGVDGSPDTADNIRNKLELLTGTDRLHHTAVDGIDEHVKDLVSKHAYSGGGGATLRVMNNGKITVQSALALNMTGAGAPTVTAGANGVTNLSFPASSLSLLTTTGTVDNTNTVFPFASKPNIIYVNGAGYRESHGWAWNSSTLEATLDNPVGINGDIYGT